MKTPLLEPVSGSKAAGFSLVELVVVVAVMATLAVGASLVATNRQDAPADIHVLTQSFERARSAALHSRQTQGLRLTARGVARFERAQGRWQETGTERRWRRGVRVSADLAQQGRAGPNVVLLGDGTVSGFAVDFASGTRCVLDTAAGLTCG